MKLPLKSSGRLRLSHLGLLIGAIVAMTAGLVMSGSRVDSDSIVRGFNASGNLKPGWVVALSQNKNDTVEAAPASDSGRIYGVVVDPSSAPLTIQKPNQQIFVATGGSYSVLVSNKNGSIKSGDYLSISDIDGIGAKATASQSFVLGQALGVFDGTSGVLMHQGDGSVIGQINVQIAVSRSPFFKSDSKVPQPLRRLGEAIAGKSVSALRIYSALAVFIVTAAVATTLLLGGIRSGMVAIGRNPLSRHSVIQGLTRIVTASVLVFIGGLFGIYLLLRI